MHIHSKAQWGWHVVDNHPDRDGEASRREAFDTTNWWSLDRKRHVVHSAHSRKAAGAQQVKPFKSCQLLPNDALVALHMCFWLCLTCIITQPWRHNYHHFVYLIWSHLNIKSRVTETLMSQTAVLKVQSVSQSVDFKATKWNESGG